LNKAEQKEVIFEIYGLWSRERSGRTGTLWVGCSSLSMISVTACSCWARVLTRLGRRCAAKAGVPDSAPESRDLGGREAAHARAAWLTTKPQAHYITGLSSLCPSDKTHKATPKSTRQQPQHRGAATASWLGNTALPGSSGAGQGF